ncbi:MAG: ExbD/TolR family protein [Bacteroidota bacterium]
MSFKRKTKIKPDFNMASMTDLVFLLLIFFMITSTLVSPNAIKVSLPTANSQVTTKTTLSVSVTPELKYFVDGTEVTKEMLESSVNSALVKLAAQDPVISLNIDKTVAVEHLVYVMQTCNKLNAKVVLATQPE